MVREVAHQTDAYPVVIHPACVAMRSVFLPPPPVADFDFAVALSQRTVIDHKVIAQPV